MVMGTLREVRGRDSLRNGEPARMGSLETGNLHVGSKSDCGISDPVRDEEKGHTFQGSTVSESEDSGLTGWAGGCAGRVDLSCPLVVGTGSLKIRRQGGWSGGKSGGVRTADPLGANQMDCFHSAKNLGTSDAITRGGTNFERG